MLRIEKILVLLLLTLIVTACGQIGSQGMDKIAVIRWDKVVAAHPQHARLERGEKTVKSLVIRREAQANLGKSQMGSVQHLRNLKQLSEKSYLDAELQTRLLEKEQVGNDRLRLKAYAFAKEAEVQLAPRRQTLEDEYQLRIFNLRLEKDRTRTDIRPHEEAKVAEALVVLDKKIQELVAERERKLQNLDKEKQAYISQKMAPIIAAFHQEMQNFIAQKKEENQQSMHNSEGKYAKMLAAAPEALTKALAIMDQEIDKQQDKNNTLKKQINSDIESIVVKLAKERGYTIVFNTFKANVSADDITDDIIVELKKIKNK